ncbi:PAS domain S-box protein (plasmid) [Haloarcula marismortui]|uniref:PAS domain-containing sensor histidine kinase n=1 Tax=Haloarcula marismortui TaxID=2238 RepID=UPI003C7771F7
MVATDETEDQPTQLLYVNDDESFRELLSVRLSATGSSLDISTVATGEMAIESLNKKSFDCVVTAYSLPERTGIEIIQQINRRFNEIPTILFTGSGSEEVAREATQAGVSDYIPIQANQESFKLLANRIETLVDSVRNKTAAKEAKTQLEQTLERTTDAVYTVDTAWHIEYLNENMAQRIDYSKEELVGKNLWDKFPSLTGTKLEEKFRTAMDTCEALSFEQYLGEPFNYWVSVNVFPDNDGMSVFSREITEQKERRAELERYESITERMAEGVAVVDSNQQVEYINSQIGLFTHMDTNEIIGTSAPSVVSAVSTPAAANQFETNLDLALQDANESFERVDVPVKQGGEERIFECMFSSLQHDSERKAIITVRDATTERNAQAALDEANQRLQSLIQVTPSPVMEIDLDGDVVGWNRAAEETFGWTSEEVIGEFNPIVSEDRQGDFSENFERVLSGERIRRKEVRRETKDGSCLDLYLSVAPVTNSNGETTNIIAVLEDISEIKRQERQVRRNDEALRSLYEISADKNLEFKQKIDRMLEEGRQYLDLPFAFLSRKGGDTQHIVRGAGTHELLQTGASEPWSKSYCQKTAQQDGLLGIQYAKNEGWESTAPYERFGIECYLGGKVVVDEKMYGTLCFAGDEAREQPFTEAERSYVKLLVQWASYELERQTFVNKLEQLQELTTELTKEEDPDVIAQTAADATAEILSFETTGIWRHNGESDVLVPIAKGGTATEVVDDQPRFQGGESLAWEAYTAQEMRTYDNVQQEEGVYNAETSIRGEILAPLGEQGLLAAASTSISGFSQTDIELVQILSTAIESAISRSNREQDLRRQNERLDQFASVVAHDLRNPLTIAAGFLEIAEETGDHEHFEKVESAHTRIERLIEDLLTLARGETTVEDVEELDLETIVTEAWGFVDTAEATLSITDDLPMVAVDESRLTQVFENLFRNAIEHGGEDVEVSVGRLNGDSGFFVEDNGTGIPADRREKVLEHGVTSSDGGTGFGLSIVKDIAKAHGWTVRVTDGVTGGARFEFVTSE